MQKSRLFYGKKNFDIKIGQKDQIHQSTVRPMVYATLKEKIAITKL